MEKLESGRLRGMARPVPHALFFLMMRRPAASRLLPNPTLFRPCVTEKLESGRLRGMARPVPHARRQTVELQTCARRVTVKLRCGARRVAEKLESGARRATEKPGSPPLRLRAQPAPHARHTEQKR